MRFVELLKYYRLRFLGSKRQFIEKRSAQHLFRQGRASSFKTVILCLISLALMLVDHRYDYLESVRNYLSSLIYPIEYIVNFPVKAGYWLSTNLATQYHLIEENAKLHEENLFLRVSLQKFNELQSENNRLRKFLDSAEKVKDRVSIAEVLAVDLEPTSRKIRINKGTNNGVFKGQPLVDAQGVIGQIVHAGVFSSTVMLITDPSHVLPVQISRTGVRAFSVGSSISNQLDLLYLPSDASVNVGDSLITSGFGERFPAGYLVGRVIDVKTDVGQAYAQVRVEPSARLERNREVLLVWNTPQDKLPVDVDSNKETDDQ